MSYYKQKLSAELLNRCYDLAGTRIRQYLKAETDKVRSLLRPGDTVLELGCGYGRVFPELEAKRIELWGIDYAIENLLYAREYLKESDRYRLACMDASRLGFGDESFDVVFCVQNGICAFNVHQPLLIAEAMRVTKSGGTVIFSTYSDKSWDARVEWFEQQSQAGLLGEIDYNRTVNGRIVCKDGFSSGRLTEGDFRLLTESVAGKVTLTEVDDSSLFCVIQKDL